MKNKILITFTVGLITSCLFSCNSTKASKLYIIGDSQIEIGETKGYKVVIAPQEAAKETITWSSSNPDIAYTDSNGSITGVAKGKAILTASAGGGKIKAEHEIFVGGFIEKQIEDFTIVSDKGSTLSNGEFLTLTAKFTPEDATDQTIKWTSSNPRVASVSDYGVVKAEHYFKNDSENKVTITGVSKDKKIVKSFELNITEGYGTKKNIKSFSEPKCIINYKNRIKETDQKIESTKINRDNAKNYANNHFYKYDENNEKDKEIYKVGNQNPFKFKSVIATGDGFKDYIEDNPYQTFMLEKWNGTEYIDVTSSYVASSYKGNEIQFTDSDVNQIFKLTITPDSERYEGIDSFMKSSIEFKVIDGYNAYDFSGLTTVDNWSLENARSIDDDELKDIINKGEFEDLWGEYKRINKINVPQDGKSWGYKATILHNDISITTNELPESIIWTDKETDDFVNGKKFENSKNLFNQFVEIKKNIHQEEWKELPENVIRAKCYDLFKGSRKDHTSIFLRRTSGSDYTLEGNYFSIDETDIKPVVFFDDRTLDEYSKINLHYSSLFTFGVSTFAMHEKSSRSTEGILYDKYRPYGFTDKNQYQKITVNNLSLIGNTKKDGTHDEGIGGDNLFHSVHTNAEFNNVITSNAYCSFFNNGDTSVRDDLKMIITTCKAIDNFAVFTFAKGKTETIIKDSFFKDAGSAGIKMLEDDIHDRAPILDLNNCYVECFITGDEIFNKNLGISILIKLIAQAGYQAFEQYRDVKYGKDGIYAKDPSHNFIKIEDDIVYVNFVTMHYYENTFAPENIGKAKMKSNGVDIFNMVEDAKDESVVKKYMDMAGTLLPGVAIKSDKGGHARLPLKDIVTANDMEVYDEEITPSIFSNPTMKFSEYVADKDNIDNTYKTLPKTMADLFRGDYLSCYIKPPLAKPGYMFAFVLGYK